MLYLSEVKGVEGFEAKVVAKSAWRNDELGEYPIVTFELTYPRLIHSEFMTHRLFSRNAASSRAIPIKKMIQQIKHNPARPVHWGKNKSGMQADGELGAVKKWIAQKLWSSAARSAGRIAQLMDRAGVHKQIANRILEPFQHIRVVMTTTDIGNFMNLRDHEDAQPEIRYLAELMSQAYEKAETAYLQSDDWHTPYFEKGYWKGVNYEKTINDDGELVATSRMVNIHGFTLDDALRVSASCAAQASFRSLDNSLARARRIYKRLVESKPIHASPFEHQASPMHYDDEIKFDRRFYEWSKGVTHQDCNGDLWSGNFCGWIQHRQLIREHNALDRKLEAT